MIKIKWYIVCILFLTSFYLLPTSSAATELQLVYEKNIKKIPPPYKDALFPERSVEVEQEELSHLEIMIGLGDGYLYIDDEQKKTIFDFNKRRIISLYKDKKTYENSLLFAHIGARDAEFGNRLFLRKTQKAAGPLEQNQDSSNLLDSYKLFELETLFCLEAKEAESKQHIKQKRKNTFYQYVVNGETVVECSFTESNIPEQHKEMFAKYLLYDCNLHPEIWRSLLAHNKIPQALSYRYKNFLSTYYVQLDLKSVKENEKDGYTIPPDFKVDLENELDVIIYKALTKKSKIHQLTKQEFIEFADRAFDQGNYLDAMLALVEYNLQTGEEISDEMRKLVPVQKDRQLALYLSSLGFSSKEEAKRSLQLLGAIEREKLKKGYVIDIIRANAKMLLGDLLEAKELFLKVLKINPYIAGVYIDLGEVFRRLYEMPADWKCWDTARSLYPQHPLLKKINRYEEWLLSEYPKFF